MKAYFHVTRIALLCGYVIISMVVSGGGCSELNRSSRSLIERDKDDYLGKLGKIYATKIRPIEQVYSFDTFNSPCLTKAEIECKPIILLLGQYSTGKTSFIRYLLQKEYPGTHIGPEPTTDRFVAVMSGASDRIIPGNAASSQSDKPFRGLEKFGNAFLTKFQISETDSPLLEKVTFIDTPGVLSGEKQRIGRSYDFVNVCEWFAERADMILLIFDAYKLDISDEFKRVMGTLRGHDDKIRVVLNKSSIINSQQLMRVYGALMWSLGKVIQTPEVIRVYIGSFVERETQFSIGEQTNMPEFNNELIRAEHKDLITDILQLPKNALIRKINAVVRRTRQARVHAYIMGYLKSEMPSLFGRSAKQNSLTNNLAEIFEKIQRVNNLAAGDFPEIDKFRQTLRLINLNSYPKLSSRQLNLIEETLNNDLPSLLQIIPSPLRPFKIQPKNPFVSDIPHDDSSIWLRSSINFSDYHDLFFSFLSSEETVVPKISGVALKDFFLESGLSIDELSEIWKLADMDRDGYLGKEEFCLAMHFIKACIMGFELPLEVPQSLLPSPSNQQSHGNVIVMSNFTKPLLY